jgi:hypothetical protein
MTIQRTSRDAYEEIKSDAAIVWVARSHEPKQQELF